MNMRLFFKNDDDYMLLEGNKMDSIFIFTHGYGSSPLDLLPLAREINNSGYACALMLLKGHGGHGKEIIGIEYSDWKKQLTDAINYYKEKYNNIYLIGFSLGATLSIDVAIDNKNISGIVGISTFIKPSTRTTIAIIKILKFFKIKMLPRMLQVTNKKTINEITYSKTIPLIETELMIDEVKKIAPIQSGVKCKAMFLHSIDDKVSSYEEIINLKNINENIKIITLRKLKHFIQFDIPQKALSDVINCFLTGKRTSKNDNYQDLKDTYLHMSTEFNHWSLILFKLIVGFFSIFGALVYFSLPDIIQEKSTSPYYLISYSIINCFFIILSSLYFFYTNRVNVYIKHYIEPYLHIVPWVTFRTNKYLSGSESTCITNRVSLAVFGIPLLISTGSLFYLIINYMDNYIVNTFDNMLLVFALLFSLILYFSAIVSLVTLQKYTKRELYYLKSEKLGSLELLSKILILFNKISPGCVKQNKV